MIAELQLMIDEVPVMVRVHFTAFVC